MENNEFPNAKATLNKIKEKLNIVSNKENMFTSFETCERELEKMKESGTYVERKTETGELASENDLPSKYKDFPNLYGILQTPTFKKIIGDQSNNFAVHDDTKEPVIVYHATPIEIPIKEGLKPYKERSGPPTNLNKIEGPVMYIRRKFNLFPINNLGLYFAQDANSTKRKAVARTRNGNSDPRNLYPCFIHISKPYISGGNTESEYSYEDSDGLINLKSQDFSVKSEKQIMHIPFNFIGAYNPKED